MDLHRVTAEEALAHVCQYAEYDATGAEVGYCYAFLDLQLSLWRSTQPEEAQPADDPEGRRFQAVAIAKKGYFVAGM